VASARRAYSSSAPRQDRVQRPRRPGLACAGAVALGVQAGRKRQQEGRLAASLARLLGRGSGPSGPSQALPPSTARMRPLSASILDRLAEDGKGK